MTCWAWWAPPISIRAAFGLNYEVCALVYTPVFAQQLADQFSRDLAQAERIFEHRPQPLPQRLGDAVARLFSPLL